MLRSAYHRTLFTPKVTERNAKYVFQIHPSVSDLNFLNNLSAQVRVNITLNITQLLKSLNY